MAVFINEVDAQRPCPISGSRKALVVSENDRHKKPLRNVINKESGLIYVDPVPFENTEEFYKTEYRKSYKGVHQPKAKHVYRAGKVALNRFSRIKPLINDSSVCLDAGSSSGEFVYLLTKRGFKAQGVEANEPYANYSKEQLDIPVSICPFSQFDPGHKFDLITMFHVLEHLENPLEDLARLGAHLKTGGRFVIEVPNILYPNMAFGNKWHPGHLFSFSETTLPALMQVSGFETLSCSPLGDGCNLWGEFVKTKPESKETVKFTASPTQALAALRREKLLYYFRIYNFVKFIPKFFRQIQERIKSHNKTGRLILNELYEG